MSTIVTSPKSTVFVKLVFNHRTPKVKVQVVDFLTGSDGGNVVLFGLVFRMEL